MLLSPAAERSQDGLLSVLWELLEDQSHRELFGLELGSGTGQHVVHFAQEMPFVTWQPSDIREEAQNSIRAYIGATKAKTVLEPVYLDASQPWEKWAGLPQSSCDIIIAINLLQYSPFRTKSLTLPLTVRVLCTDRFTAKFLIEVIIPIPLEWGLWSEQGTCVPLCSRLECTWQRERCNFLIFSLDVPVTTQHGVRQQIRCFNFINVLLLLLA
uniref:Zgc:103625 n=1 Tax=Sinocyclocheilus grahami TaxID=75366 RepID=A0A672K868_SINGR